MDESIFNQFRYAWKKVCSVNVSSLGKRSELRMYFPADKLVFFFVYRSPTLSWILFNASVVNMERGNEDPVVRHLLKPDWNGSRIEFMNVLQHF